MTDLIIIKDDEDILNNFEAIIRGEMDGEIPLPIPVINKIEWYNNARYYCQILGIPEETASMIVENNGWYIIDSKSCSLTIGQLLTEQEFKDAKSQFGESGFVALTGAECLDTLIRKCDLYALFERYSSEYKNLSSIGHDIIKRLENDIDPNPLFQKLIPRTDMVKTGYILETLYRILKYKESLLIRKIRILPGNLRYRVQSLVESAPWAIYDLMNAYAMIARSAARYNRAIDFGAPRIFIDNEKLLMQTNVDLLFFRSLTKVPNSRGCTLMSILMRTMELY